MHDAPSFGTNLTTMQTFFSPQNIFSTVVGCTLLFGAATQLSERTIAQFYSSVHLAFRDFFFIF